MYSEHISAIREDLRDGFYETEEEAEEMREKIREYDEYREYCLDMRFEQERDDARCEAYWEARYE